MAFCTNCGTQLPEGANNCTNCGTPVVTPTAAEQPAVVETAPAPAPAPTTSAPGNAMAIASLVCGIVSLLCTGGILSVLALIFGIVAKKQGSKSGMATAGIVLAVIGIVLAVISVAIGVIVGIGTAATMGEYYGGYYYY